MSIEPRKIKCDAGFIGCIKEHTETNFGDGFPEWGHVGGVLKDGKEVFLCPNCKNIVIEFIKKRQVE